MPLVTRIFSLAVTDLAELAVNHFLWDQESDPLDNQRVLCSCFLRTLRRCSLQGYRRILLLLFHIASLMPIDEVNWDLQRHLQFHVKVPLFHTILLFYQQVWSNLRHN